MLLSIVVIGRNEVTNVGRLGRSLADVVAHFGTMCETIYVDSASSDGTSEAAKQCFSRVVVLEEHPDLSASAGRQVGMSLARGDWVLHMDGDMELSPAFARWLVLTDLSGESAAGIVGYGIDVFPSGLHRKRTEGQLISGEFVRYFGGAILLRRDAVLAAGNWDPRIASNEEIELYTRIRASHGLIRFVDVDMVLHHTEQPRRWYTLLGLLSPQVSGTRYFGFGQVIRARLLSHSFMSLVHFFPYPFVWWCVLAASLSFALARLWFASLVVLVAGALYVVTMKGCQFLLVYFFMFVQAVRGYGHLDRSFRPRIASDWSPGQGDQGRGYMNGS